MSAPALPPTTDKQLPLSPASVSASTARSAAPLPDPDPADSPTPAQPGGEGHAPKNAESHIAPPAEDSLNRAANMNDNAAHPEGPNSQNNSKPPQIPQQAPSAQMDGLSIADASTQGTDPSSNSPSPRQSHQKWTDSFDQTNPSSRLPETPPKHADMSIDPQDDSFADFSEKDDGPEAAVTSGGGDDSRSEIQSIMDQFGEGVEGPGMDEIMSPRLEKANPMFGTSSPFPPRKSSLQPPERNISEQMESQDQETPAPEPSTSVQSQPPQEPPPAKEKGPASSAAQTAPNLHKPPPPEPDPEPDLPFDFHRFLEQLRHRTADPVAKFLRSFLYEFGKKQWMVHEQVKIISDFLEFISKKMAQCEVWRAVSDAEFDNAREGMEKLVMNRLYTQTFSPAIPPPEPMLGKNRRRGPQQGPGRRGQHQEDVERDEVLAQKIRIYNWVREEHLDIKPVDEKGTKFLKLAQQELLKIRNYRAPRDKVICILNCCKVIFGFLKNAQSDQSADSFVPLLIFTVLRANPDHLVSNVQYILRFRNPDKLGGETGYYISSLMGAIQFIENLDRTSLTISDEDFEKNVEASVSAIAERKSLDQERQLQPRSSTNRHPSPAPGGMHISEKSALSRPEVTPRNSLDAERIPARSNSVRASSSNHQQDSEDGDNAAVAGLLRTIQRPLSTIGRIFSDDFTNEKSSGSQQQSSGASLYPGSRSHPLRRHTDEPMSEAGRLSEEQQRQLQQASVEDAEARQASVDTEEALRIQRQEHKVVVDTLVGMFPGLDRDVIDDVVRMKDGRVGLAVDACLALSN
ncbi:guanine nucleotide exchange factor Vps9 [Phyllosticta citricarpa]|uniref:Guanine nucleotide exchange factor Vps9 n=1 Tax=Phyllosticta citricarpa TaxID=55181 RepID=A0ABR1LSZ0_9PEZI